MTRLKLPEIVMMVLAVLGGLGILFVIVTGLIRVAARRTMAETGGVGAVVGGVSVNLFAILIVAVVAFVVVLAVFLWRR